MLNCQVPEGRIVDKDGRIDVVKIWSTIQGEGPLAGSPAIFIRLAGCNFQCPACDTDYTSGRRKMFPAEIVEEINKFLHRPSTVVITGGEPLRQDVLNLCHLILDMYGIHALQIETNGAYFQPDLPYDDPRFLVVCSPKTVKVNPRLEPHIDAWKYVLSSRNVDPGDGLPTDTLLGLAKPARPTPGHGAEVYVQPLDEGDTQLNAANLAVCIESVQRHNYRLCLQLHKIIGLE